ncbi:MAG: hypothetical protein RL404_2356 [Pseudomonadota bacterium]|jgi:thiol-disulfide isomerase/thioredoxin
MAPTMIRFTLYSRSYCHLCEDMLVALRALAGEQVAVDVIDVDADPALVERYDELVPVLIGHRDDEPSIELCHYFLNENTVSEFIARR